MSYFQRPNGIKAVHSSLQKNQDNPCKMMNCKSLCVGSPSAPRKARCLEEEIKADIPVSNSTGNSFFEFNAS